MTTSRDIGDPKLLQHPSLVKYWLSERRAILQYRTAMSEDSALEMTLEVAIERWEKGPGKRWRSVKAARDSKYQTLEIERHKYLLSEQLGYDVGAEKAARDWVFHHAENWRNWWETQPQSGDAFDVP